MPIGTPGSDSPFAAAGTFVPHVVVRNLLASPQTVTVTLEYPQVATGNGSTPSTSAPLDPVAAQDGTHSPPTVQSPLAPVTVAAYSTQDISLAALMNQFPAALPFASVRIQYSGAPGSLQAQVSSIESGGNLVVDSHVQNEGNGWAGSGANPWHLDPDTESILFLTNESGQAARIGAQVAANGVTYYMTKLRLNPHETRAIDLRKLRDAQVPDFKKNLIPASATDGSVNWNRIDNVAVMGRLMVINRQQGMASNYDCSSCMCPLSYWPYLNYVSPGSCNLAVGGSQGLILYAAYESCNALYFFFDVNGADSWTSQYPYIAWVNSSGTVTGQSGGTTSVTAQYSDYSYNYNPVTYTCNASGESGGGGAACPVWQPTYAVLTETGSWSSTSCSGTGVYRQYSAYDNFYHLITTANLKWTLHENVTSSSSCNMSTGGTETEQVFTDYIANCDAGCTFTSTQWLSIVYNGYTWTLQAQDGVDSTFTKYKIHTGWDVTATTTKPYVTVTDF